MQPGIWKLTLSTSAHHAEFVGLAPVKSVKYKGYKNAAGDMEINTWHLHIMLNFGQMGILKMKQTVLQDS